MKIIILLSVLCTSKPSTTTLKMGCKPKVQEYFMNYEQCLKTLNSASNEFKAYSFMCIESVVSPELPKASKGGN